MQGCIVACDVSCAVQVADVNNMQEVNETWREVFRTLAPSAAWGSFECDSNDLLTLYRKGMLSLVEYESENLFAQDSGPKQRWRQIMKASPP